VVGWKRKPRSAPIETIRASVIGDHEEMEGPPGPRLIIDADYTPKAPQTAGPSWTRVVVLDQTTQPTQASLAAFTATV
jgi:hypothetical protein